MSTFLLCQLYPTLYYGTVSYRLLIITHLQSKAHAIFYDQKVKVLNPNIKWCLFKSNNWRNYSSHKRE